MRRLRCRIGTFALPALVCAMLLGACNAGPATNPVANAPEGADSAAALGATQPKPMIYVPNLARDKVTAYGLDGKPALTINTGIDVPFGVTVDKNGKIYVANTVPDTGGSVTTYTPDGKQTTPTIPTG